MTKSARKSPRSEDQSTPQPIHQRTMQLPELMREELCGVVTRLGLLAVESMLRQDVEALCGPRYSRGQVSALTSMGPRFLTTIPPLGSICVTRAIVDQAALRDPVFDERERAGFWRAR